jgi:hypothetical protein
MDKRDRRFLILIGVLCGVFVLLEVLYYFNYFHFLD